MMLQPRHTTRRTYVLPDIVGGAPLTTFVGIIIPEATTNLVTNPSIETATTGYTAVGGSIAQSATKQYHGTYSLAVTPTAATTDGVFYGTISLTSGTTYTLSCKFWGLPGVKYKISFATTGGVDLAVKAFLGTGRWQWVSVTYTETSSTTRRLYFTKNTHTSTGVFYIDGVQVEAKAYATTYCDGDQLGLLVGQSPVPYGWNGTPHASTSYRTALTRAGGRVMDIKTAYGFLLTAILGLGMAVPNNISVPYTVLDGARFQRTQKPPRTISLVGRFQGTTPAHLDRLRSDMRTVVDRDYVPIQQPLLLMVEPRDDCGAATGDFATAQCLYAGGLEGNDTSAIAEDAAPAFTMYLPYISGGDGGAALGVQTSVSNANYILQRSTAGVWSAMSTGASTNPVRALARGLDGKIYIGGQFALLGGVANTVRIGYWDPSDNAFHAMGTGATGGDVLGLSVGPDGTVYACGSFTGMGGVANTGNWAKWNGTAWASITGGSLGVGITLNTILAAPDNQIYAGGPSSGTGTFIRWDNVSTLTSYATNAGGSVNAIVYVPNGLFYLGGSFTTIGGTAINRIASFNGSAFANVSGVGGTAGANGTVNDLAFNAASVLFMVGAFTTVDGVTTGQAAQWNGTVWSSVSSTYNATMQSVALGPNGNMYFGASGAVGGAPGWLSDQSLSRYIGSNTILGLDVDLPGSNAVIYDWLFLPDGSLVLAFGNSGTATSATVTTVTNTTSSLVYPKLIIKGPSSGTSRVYQIINYTTGAAIYLDYIIAAGETATFIFDPNNPSYTSTSQGDLSSKILPGSTPTPLYLAPGDNSVSFFAASSTVTATLKWQNRYNGTADLVN